MFVADKANQEQLVALFYPSISFHIADRRHQKKGTFFFVIYYSSIRKWHKHDKMPLLYFMLHSYVRKTANTERYVHFQGIYNSCIAFRYIRTSGMLFFLNASKHEDLNNFLYDEPKLKKVKKSDVNFM
jgi:hypothetical protein